MRNVDLASLHAAVVALLAYKMTAMYIAISIIRLMDVQYAESVKPSFDYFVLLNRPLSRAYYAKLEPAIWP